MTDKPIKLTYTQRHVLRSLVDDEPHRRLGWGSSCTNPSGCALEKRGLAAYEWDRTRPYPWGRWVATDAGRAEMA